MGKEAINGIAFIYNDNSVKYLKSYSFKTSFTSCPENIKICFTDKFDERCIWKKSDFTNDVFETIEKYKQLDDSIKIITRVDSVFLRSMKVKRLNGIIIDNKKEKEKV